MTDERPEGTLPPDPDFATPSPAPAPSWGAPAQPPPPPLAPIVNQAPAPPASPAGQQPAVAWAAPAPAVAVQGGRTGLAAVAGIALLILGILGALIGLLVFAVAGMVGSLGSGGFFDEVPGMPPGFETAIGGFVVVLGVIILVYSLLYVIGGIGVLRSRGWGRVIGIVVGIISGLIWISAATTPAPGGEQSSVLFAFVLLAVHAYIVVVLIAFWRSKATA